MRSELMRSELQAKKTPARAAVDQCRQDLANDGSIESATLQFGHDEPLTIYERERPADGQPAGIDQPAEGAVGSRTCWDVWREQIGDAICDTIDRLRSLTDDLKDLKQEEKEARDRVAEQKESVLTLERQLRELATDMKRVKDGSYTPRAKQQALPFQAGQADSAGSVRPDPGETAGFEALGLSESFRAKLAESQLAKEVKLKTVADLERAIAGDEWWHKKIKGVGKTKLDDLLDAIVTYRAEFPVPTADDGRRKQCTDIDCQQHYSHGLFVASFTQGAPDECPKCGNHKFWQLVDPAEFSIEGETPEDMPSGEEQ